MASGLVGTLYPLLHSLEKKGYLRSITRMGRKALLSAKDRVRELFSELIENE